ncbi:hypothetical protein KM043_015331 [Ampulex compressa]|nr:hypothetical protein KM043_015331 [Ampulex compressa]
MCTAAGRYSRSWCVSHWRPAEVDGLPLGRFRRRSAMLGTRSVMESLAAPSVEAMTPSTPLLPPNGPPPSPPGAPTLAYPTLRRSPILPPLTRIASPPPPALAEPPTPTSILLRATLSSRM